MIPLRIQVRAWLATLSRDQIVAKLGDMEPSEREEYRYWLNEDRRQAREGATLMPAGEWALYKERGGQ